LRNKNSLAEIKLQSTGSDKGSQHFFGSKIGKQLQLCGRAHYRTTRKNLDSRTQLDKSIECASGGDPLLLYKILHLLFFTLLRILCALCLVSRKNYQHVLDSGPLEFQFLLPTGYLTNPFRTLSLSFWVIGKTPGLISRNNFVKKKFSLSAIAIMSWQDVTPSSLCSGVKEFGTKRAHNFLFPNPLSESEELQCWGSSRILLSFLMRLDGHF
jgi:hypothetical protein